MQIIRYDDEARMIEESKKISEKVVKEFALYHFCCNCRYGPIPCKGLSFKVCAPDIRYAIMFILDAAVKGEMKLPREEGRWTKRDSEYPYLTRDDVNEITDLLPRDPTGYTLIAVCSKEKK